jgi:DMSO/TMAO reductase YedYZ molybdopterin-dependent catalytic subunit
MSSSQSRRSFLRYTTTGTAALVLGEGCATNRPPVELHAGTIRLRQRNPETETVVEGTPAPHFVSRDAGSREMKWGPVADYGDTVPNDRFYVHSRARPPTIDLRAWRLEVTGDAIGRPRTFSFDELVALPQVTHRRTLDCGANCRAFFPRLPKRRDAKWLPIGFTQWHFGAVGCADWTGVRLSDVLAAAGLANGVEVLFTGLDAVRVGEGSVVPYEQVVPIDKVLASDTLLAYRMNREDLPIDHGFPVRVIFSGWGGNTSVKWVGRIAVSKQKIPYPIFQSRQVIYGPDIPKPFIPTEGHVRSAMELDEDMTLAPGDHVLRGRAWSGAGAIERVDVTIEQLVAPGVWRAVWNPPWRQAELLGSVEPMQWVRFEVPWKNVPPGHFRIMSRAKDRMGNVQPRPEDVVWNQQGLGYNGHAPLEIAVLPMDRMP